MGNWSNMTGSDVAQLAEYLRRFKMVSGWTLRDIAERTGVKHLVVHRAVTGEGGVTDEHRDKLLDFLVNNPGWDSIAERMDKYRAALGTPTEGSTTP